MTKDLLENYTLGEPAGTSSLSSSESYYQYAAEPKHFTFHLTNKDNSPAKELSFLPNTDYRDVLVLRNLYDSIVSEYLYHYKGFECGMAHKYKSFEFLKHWDEYISYELNPPPSFNHTLCRYLQNTARDPDRRIPSVRAYDDWVMRYYYSGILSQWALSQQIPQIKEWTLTLCYEDFMSQDRDLKTINRVIDFFFGDGTSVQKPWIRIPPGHVQYSGEHSTDHDRSIHDHVVKLIQQVDEKYYNGDIAWANSILPCQSRTTKKK